MGCAYGKPTSIQHVQHGTQSPEKEFNKSSLNSRFSSSSLRLKNILGTASSNVGFSLLDDSKPNKSLKFSNDHIDLMEKLKKKREKKGEHVLTICNPIPGTVPKTSEGEQVAAGWPSWLSSVAGEAIKGWIPRKADSFQKLSKIGQGTYSNVYKARDMINKKIVALKRIRFDNMDPQSVKFMAREILILRRLDHQNVVKLEGLVTSRDSCNVYLVFDYMEHDLTGLVAIPGNKFTVPQVKCYMNQLLNGLEHCHNRGVLHRDIKGSNLLIGDNGILKIADFGLASFFDPDKNYPMTSRVVTLWYRPPELILGACHYGIAVDLWSTGCILGELCYGKPIMPGRTEVEQLHKIYKLCGSPSEDFWRKSNLLHSAVFKPQRPYKRCISQTFKDFPVHALKLMEILLSIDPGLRGTANSALKSEFFTTNPIACHPSSLPKFPPSKEIDVKFRDEARRQRTMRGNSMKNDVGKRTHESRKVQVPNSNADLAALIQKKHSRSNSKSRSGMFKLYQEYIPPGLSKDQTKQSHPSKESNKHTLEHRYSNPTYSGPLIYGSGWVKSDWKQMDPPRISTDDPEFSIFSGLVKKRMSSGGSHAMLESISQRGRLSGTHIEMDMTRKDGKGSPGGKIYFSGPLHAPTKNVDQMLKQHERHLQEVARKVRRDKAKSSCQVNNQTKT